MAIELETDVARDLVEMKLHSIRETIDEILQNWNLTIPQDLISKAKHGEIKEAEMDAITMRQLLSDLAKYELILKNINNTG